MKTSKNRGTYYSPFTISLALGIAFCLMVKNGVFSFLGPSPTYVTTLVGTFGTIAFGILMYKKGKI